jgi:uncharacterized ParB-like nuclease family protein
MLELSGMMCETAQVATSAVEGQRQAPIDEAVSTAGMRTRVVYRSYLAESGCSRINGHDQRGRDFMSSR